MAICGGYIKLCVVYTVIAIPVFSNSQGVFSNQAHLSLFQNSPYGNLYRQPVGQNRPPIHLSHPRGDLIHPSIGQSSPYTDNQQPGLLHIRPSGIQNRPSIGQIYPGLIHIQPSKDQNRHSRVQNRPSIDRPFVDPNRPFTEQIQYPGEPTLPVVGPNRPTVDLNRPVVNQFRPTVDQFRPNLAQIRPSVPTANDVENNEGYEWEQEEMFEGDIDVVDTLGDRNGVTETDRLWPNNTVYYKFKGPDVTKKGMDIVRWAMRHIQDRTCIKFREQTTERDFISIQFHSKGCWSSVGRTGGEQVLNLNKDGCLGSKGTAVHEILHALGFYHEQSRADRDQFITVVKNNIKKGKEGNFIQVHTSSAQGVPYDYDSVLHYSQKAFSVDGKKPTIVSKVDPNRKNFGNRQGLTNFDAMKINLLYSCGLRRFRL